MLRPRSLGRVVSSWTFRCPALTGVVALLMLSFTTCLHGAATPVAGEEPYVFRTWSGQEVACFRGTFEVPENRRAAKSRTIPIEYVRLPATGDRRGPPIVYLAGGPGASGIQAINYRFALFMALRKYGDVIALDQRGTGRRNAVPDYRSQQVLPADTPCSDDEFIELHRDALKAALVFWKQRGADIAGYNTIENARDLDALRRHLGADKISLWGISYGSHLALAALREIGNSLDRVILVSVEGLDQTVKLPARTEAYFDRLQAAVDAQPQAKAAYPDIRGMMRRVHARLEQSPVTVQLKPDGGGTINFLLHRRDLQMLAGVLIADPDSAAAMLRIYRALDRGEPPSFAGIPSRLLPDHFLSAGPAITLGAMSTLMDLASGIGAQRKIEVARQAREAVLGGWLDSTLYYDGIAPELDLGDAFRALPSSDVPVLLLSGTLDGRTTMESQSEAVAGLHHLTRIVVENSGHNPPFTPEILAAMDRFLLGQPATETRIEVDPPQFAP